MGKWIDYIVGLAAILLIVGAIVVLDRVIDEHNKKLLQELEQSK